MIGLVVGGGGLVAVRFGAYYGLQARSTLRDADAQCRDPEEVESCPGA